MSYELATENINYEDYSSGRVLYNQQGATSFPVRLTCEIFLRCAAILEREGNHGPYQVFDPLCGGAYSLTILGLFYSQKINKIVASDIDEAIIELANKNLSLLTEDGLAKRMQQINNLYQEYGKESHKDALQSGEKFQELLRQMPHKIETNCFVSDAMNLKHSFISDKIDIVMTDLPYGEVVDWVNVDSESEAIRLLLENLHPILAKSSVVAVTSRKKAEIQNKNYKRVDKFNVGKRQIVLLQPIF